MRFDLPTTSVRELTLLHVLEPAISPTVAELQQQRQHFPKAEMADAEESLRALVNSARAAGVARGKIDNTHGSSDA